MSHWNADISFGRTAQSRFHDYEVDTDQGTEYIHAYSYAHARRLVEDIGFFVIYITLVTRHD